MSLPTLKDFRGERIDMTCRRCDRHGEYDRKALVKKFGAERWLGKSVQLG